MEVKHATDQHVGTLRAEKTGLTRKTQISQGAVELIHHMFGGGNVFLSNCMEGRGRGGLRRRGNGREGREERVGVVERETKQ